MIVEMTHPETKETVRLNLDDNEMFTMQEVLKPAVGGEKLKGMIENLSVPAEVKVLLSELINLTIKAGNVLLNIGHKIIEMILYFVKKFPNTSVGLVIGASIGVLVSGIPVIGYLIGWLLLPVFTALGLALGFWTDIANKELENVVSQGINQVFGCLRNISVDSPSPTV